MGKPRSVSPTIFLLVILLVTAGEKTEAKPWWKKVGDSIGNIAGGIRNAVGNYKPVEMGLSLKGGFCVRKLLSLNTNVFSEWCIALNDPRAPMLVHSNGPYGENIFWAGKNNWSPRDIVNVWADEDKFYDVKGNTCEPQHMCGHYTQIVWRDSTKVGCASVDCSNGGVYAICVYNPPGNYEGENPFGSYDDQIGLARDDPPAVIGGMA
ncbi:unnamed protein product [Arabidopsis thaliana]|uniref:(thale cress) hypothetical protein n=1 Tax=Arabidopsis thaliana TaxID=3702 RepID=A0A7G2DQG5_ARATH|nr:unnamed protein product [Arabidopsis thaliana]